MRRESFVSAVVRGDAGASLDLLLGLASTTEVPAFVRCGFRNDGLDVSLARLCMGSGRVDVLRQLLAAAPGDLAPEDVCMWSAHAGVQSESMASAAIQACSVDGMRLALEVQPSHPELQAGPGSGKQESLLYKVVEDAAMSIRREMATHRVAMAKLLIAHGCDLYAPHYGARSCEAMVFGFTWRDDCAHLQAELIEACHHAGILDIDTPLGPNEGHDHESPLEATIRNGNVEGASMLVKLGCELSKTEDELIDLARSIDRRADEMAASLTRALMERRIGVQAAPPTPAPGRKSRAQL